MSERIYSVIVHICTAVGCPVLFVLCEYWLRFFWFEYSNFQTWKNEATLIRQEKTQLTLTKLYEWKREQSSEVAKTTPPPKNMYMHSIYTYTVIENMAKTCHSFHSSRFGFAYLCTDSNVPYLLNQGWRRSASSVAPHALMPSHRPALFTHRIGELASQILRGYFLPRTGHV